VTTWVAVKTALAVAGLVVFGYGIRSGDPVIRWAGIAFVAVAFLMRFLPRTPPSDPPG